MAVTLTELATEHVQRFLEKDGDSVLPELLTDGDYRPDKDMADGP